MDQRDEKLWQVAKKRAGFQRSLVIYVVINAFLWFLWWVNHKEDDDGLPWPVWVMVGWGIGIVFQYMDAYGGNKNDLAQKEYEKLKSKENTNQS
jgi:uncharacterized protein (DUF486 family)